MSEHPPSAAQPRVLPIADELGEVAFPLPAADAKTLRGIWQGAAGATRVEVLEILSAEAPIAETIRAVWRKRKGRRAEPLIVFWQGRDRVLLTEPIGDPVAIVQVEPTAALAIIRKALTAPSGEAAQAALALLDRAQGSGGVAGFRNRNLLSTHYLTSGLQRENRDKWISLGNDAAALGKAKGAQLLAKLGYTPGSHASEFVVTEDGGTRVYALALQEGRSFDQAAGQGEAPALRVLTEARAKGSESAVLIAGRLLRIYATGKSQGLNDLATAGTYIELDLDLLGAEWQALLPLLFSAESHRASGLFDALRESSSRYAVGLRDRFKERVYEKVVAELVVALYNARGRRRPDADLIFHATLRLTYRLLFILYAEDRNLLPLGNSEYRRISLTQTVIRINERLKVKEPFDERQTTYWDDLFRIFDAIRLGSKEWSIPAYNGGLFEPELNEHPESAYLQSVKLTNAVLAPILNALAFDEDGAESGKVDFGDLGVRHLGTLYEGLLSYAVRFALEDLALDADGTYIRAKRGDTPVALAGQPYLTSPKGGRKTSGSYYTPAFVVRRLIDNALRPTLETHLARVEKLPVEQQWDAMLDFRVVDPATGSGHFLVDALDAIADRLAQFLRDHPHISAEPIRAARAQITAAGKEYGIEGLGETAGDFELLRRTVMRNCIYGVDLNPMAIELAKVGLWLHAFVPGLPLSYLGHNLQHGNALVGIVGHEIEAQLGDQLFGSAVKTALNEALEFSRRLAATGDLSPDEVHNSEALQAQLHEATIPLQAAFDAFACRVFAIEPEASEKKDQQRGRALLEQADGLQRVLQGTLQGPERKQITAAQKIARRLSAFHWQLAFPEVFLRENGGFDIVLGNPPWEEVTVERLGFFTRYIPGLKSYAQQSEQERIIKAFERQHPDVGEAYLAEVEEKEEFREVIRTNYVLAQSGDPDLYRAFAELALNVSRSGGALGMVYPRTLLAADGTAPYRRRLFAEATVVADFGLNNLGWIFGDVHPQFTIVALAARKDGGRTVDAAGPAANQPQWSALPNLRTHWQYSQLEKASPGLEVPLIPDARAAALFQKMVANGQPFSDALDGVTFKPWRAFDATNDRKTGLLKERGKGAKGWPVYAGRNFDLWTPEIGESEFAMNPKDGIATLLRKARLTDPQQLPQLHVHAVFRDITNRTNSRTAICALIPPERFSHNKAPVLVQRNGNERDLALRVGVMSSTPFDWGARRRVETNMNFFILNALPVPAVTLEDERASRLSELTARLSSIDERFSEFAEACGVGIATLNDDEREDAIAEIDALVASMYGLAADDLETVFADFTVDAIPEARRAAVRRHFACITSGKAGVA